MKTTPEVEKLVSEYLSSRSKDDKTHLGIEIIVQQDLSEKVASLAQTKIDEYQKAYDRSITNLLLQIETLQNLRAGCKERAIIDAIHEVLDAVTTNSLNGRKRMTK